MNQKHTPEPMEVFYEIGLMKCPSGFGEYQREGDRGEPWADDMNILMLAAQAYGELYELGRDDLPEGMDDIRGLIHNEPDTIYGYMELQPDGSEWPQYFGIDEAHITDPERIAEIEDSWA